ncbi:hypothetical protein [Paraflavitalea speifideaquila]|uniref:hypothetical protein n=1 Tax=Paraflavitalea speifideaquila TaxID=3076558 RepID=UPI0028EE20A7|nr:hypothetical protein [Paraflavitalea speifideiaquila]
MVLTYYPVSFDAVKPGDPSTYPTVTFDDPNVTAVVTSVSGPITYAVPGNSYPGQALAVELTVKIDPATPLGLKGVRVTDAGETGAGPFMPALLRIK